LPGDFFLDALRNQLLDLIGRDHILGGGHSNLDL
jgi:hypothetical protein